MNLNCKKKHVEIVDENEILIIASLNTKYKPFMSVKNYQGLCGFVPIMFKDYYSLDHYISWVFVNRNIRNSTDRKTLAMHTKHKHKCKRK